MLNNKYYIITTLNSGSFGKIYKAHYNNQLYAIKESNNNLNIKHESFIYKELKHINNIPKLFEYFVLEKKSYMVINYYEETLVDYKNRMFNSMNFINNLDTKFNIILYTLKDIHSCGFLHRDIKPSNICLNKYGEPYIIDFGLSKQYIVDNNHNIEKSITSIIGSHAFVSANILNLIEPSRRDDIYSLIFVYIYMLVQEDKISDIFQNRFELTNLEKKLTTTTINSNGVVNIIKILNYIKKMSYKQRPNYDYINNTLFVKN
tara:strand:+ start:263 stop:1045 length:783 start_codon:yes stop_codon:yes gene_type:complete